MEIFDKVTAIISELSGIETIHIEQKLQEDLGFDSLQLVMLLMMLEEKFEIRFHESDMNPFDLTTVYHVIVLIEKYIGGGRHEEYKEEN